MTSSIYPLDLVANASVGQNLDILSTPVTITPEMVGIRGGGTLRLMFSFEMEASTTISVFNNSIFKGFLNADNSSIVIPRGYYRFDIDVESDDVINLRSSEAISAVNFIRAHIVLFGA